MPSARIFPDSFITPKGSPKSTQATVKYDSSSLPTSSFSTPKDDEKNLASSSPSESVSITSTPNTNLHTPNKSNSSSSKGDLPSGSLSPFRPKTNRMTHFEPLSLDYKQDDDDDDDVVHKEPFAKLVKHQPIRLKKSSSRPNLVSQSSSSSSSSLSFFSPPTPTFSKKHSFVNISTHSENFISSIESLINFLTVNVDYFSPLNRDVLRSFEGIVQEVLIGSHENELIRILKNHGWTGSRFRLTLTQGVTNSVSNTVGISPASTLASAAKINLNQNVEKSEDIPNDENALNPSANTNTVSYSGFDSQSLLQSLSNLYLRHKSINSPQILNCLVGLGDEKGLGQVVSFCPDLLISILKKQNGKIIPDNPSTSPIATNNQFGDKSSSKKSSIVTEINNGVPTYTFNGACLLADISGFSKLSGSMCLKGASGLDELREATSGFLGILVKQVYEFQGDVIAFAGDALICVFLDDLEENQPNNDIKEDHPKYSNSCLRALQCATIIKGIYTNKLSCHLAVSYGEMKLAFLGGLRDQWVYLLNGECISELASSINDAGPKQVASSEICYKRAKEELNILYEDLIRLKDLQLKNVNEKLPSIASASTDENEFDFLSELQDAISVELIKESGNFLINNINYKAIDAAIKLLSTRVSEILPMISTKSANSSSDANTSLSSLSFSSSNSSFPAININAITGSLYNPTPTSSKSFTMMRTNSRKLLEASVSPINTNTASSVFFQDNFENKVLTEESEGKTESIELTEVDDIYTKDTKEPSDPPIMSSSNTINNAYQAIASQVVTSNNNSDNSMLKIIESAALFIPRPILSAVLSESLDHVGEFRLVTSMFLSLDTYSPISHRDPSTLQPFFLLAQQYLFENGGFLRQFLVDDKGCVLIAMWGMPSFTYANNCSRALSCAVNLVMESKKKFNHICSIGITTGNVYCGTVGALERRDYAGIGNDVNIAARLMSKAKGRVLIDKNTYNLLDQNTRMKLKSAEEMQLKGMTNKMVPYMYTANAAPRIGDFDDYPGYNSTILRREVKTILNSLLDNMSNAYYSSNFQTSFSSFNAAEPSCVYFAIIMGMPGTGKSTTADYFRHGLRKRSISSIMIQARPGHEGVPYGLMRELFFEIVGEENFVTEDQQRKLINSLLTEAFTDEFEREKARPSVELVLGVEWSEARQCRSNSLTPNSDRIYRKTMSPNSSSISSPKNSSVNDLHKSALLNSTLESQNSSIGISSPTNTELNNDENTTRPIGDLSFYKILSLLLGTKCWGIIIEDAHFCDELSWNELYLLLNGEDLNLLVLITMRSANLNHQYSVVPSMSIGSNGNPISTQIPYNSIYENNNDANIEVEGVFRYGHRFQTAPSYLSILGHSNSTVIEMKPLIEAEVREILLNTLRMDDISDQIVKLVFDVSSGNAFWCKTIALYIKEKGIDDFQMNHTSTTGNLVLNSSSKNNLNPNQTSNSNPKESLEHLIILRLEKLTIDQQLILKYAAIIGDEFSDRILSSVLPSRYQLILGENLEQLVEKGFILCLYEYPQLIFRFSNLLIHSTIFSIVPPRVAGRIHVKIAEYIETNYTKNLRAFYPLLAFHYQRSNGKRAQAFKFFIKSSDQAIKQGAYTDGLFFIDSAFKLVQSKEEYRVLLLVINRALRDLQYTTGNEKNKRKDAMVNSSDGSIRAPKYLKMKNKIEAAIEDLNKIAIKNEISTPGNKNRIIIRREPSGKLNWQPSYVASKMNDDDSDDTDSEEEVLKNFTKKSYKRKSLCIIS